MKHERILYNIIENEVRRITSVGRFINTYGIGLLGAEIACREIVRMYYNEICETVNFVDADENYVVASLIIDGGTSKTDGIPSANLYNFADNISRYVVKHFTREFIKYIYIVYGGSSVRFNVTDVLYAKSLELSSDSLPFVEIISGTQLGKLESDVAILVEKIMKW